MKGKSRGASTSVMLALLAVLLVSLGFLSSQKEGAENMCQPDEIMVGGKCVKKPMTSTMPMPQ